jgi:hypothetical protein
MNEYTTFVQRRHHKFITQKLNSWAMQWRLSSLHTPRRTTHRPAPIQASEDTTLYVRAPHTYTRTRKHSHYSRPCQKLNPWAMQWRLSSPDTSRRTSFTAKLPAIRPSSWLVEMAWNVCVPCVCVDVGVFVSACVCVFVCVHVCVCA